MTEAFQAEGSWRWTSPKTWILLAVGVTLLGVAPWGCAGPRRQPLDEPTVRVKSGSIRFEVIEGEWEQQGGHWRHKGHESQNERYRAAVTTSACSPIPNPVRHVTIKAANGATVILNFSGKRTLLNPGNAPLSAVDPQTLELAGTHVERIQLRKSASGGVHDWECSFEGTSFDELRLFAE